MSTPPLEDPDFLPLKLDLAGRRVLFLRMSAEQRVEAAFLDERALPPDAQGFWLHHHQLSAGIADLHACPDFIFHIGHCGSTLLSRLLQSWPDMQVLRELLPLRTLAEAQGQDDSVSSFAEWQALLPVLLSRWAIPQPPHRRVLIKATSSCNGLIDPILRLCPTTRVVLLDMPLEPYLATLFKSPASVRDAAAAAPLRWKFLAPRSGAEGASMESPGYAEICAMGWLAEQVRFSELLLGEHRQRLLRVNFHDLLSQPQRELGAVAGLLGLEATQLERALSSPSWTRYSKAQGYAYSTDDRSHDLALSRERFAPQIASGRAWVRAFLSQHPALTPVGVQFD